MSQFWWQKPGPLTTTAFDFSFVLALMTLTHTHNNNNNDNNNNNNNDSIIIIETAFLYQRISVAIQRYNAVCLTYTFIYDPS